MRILEWVAFPLSRGIFSTQGLNPGLTLQADSLSAEPQGKPQNTGVDSLSLLQQIFLTQESNQGLLHSRKILYQLSYQGGPCTYHNHTVLITFSSLQALSHVRLCNRMVCSTSGFPVHHQLLELTKTHVHRVSDAIQPSHLLSSPSPAVNLSQHQGLFQFFTDSDSHSTGVSASASILLMNIQS